MTYTYDITTQVGIVRLLIPDRNLATALFTDEELTALINMEPSGHPKRAAAQALETVAADRAMVLQVISTNGLSVNGASVANALQKRAVVLREQAAYEEAATGGAFDWAEMVTGNFSYRERLWDSIMREEGAISP